MEEPSERGGLIREARHFLAAALRYASARFRLAAMEGKEAGTHVLKLLACAVGALALLIFAWLFVCLALTFVLAQSLGGENAWIWATLIMAGVHLAAAVLLVFCAKAGLARKMFPLTSEELKKDQQWLEKKTKHD